MKSNWLSGLGSTTGAAASTLGCPACIPALGAVFGSLGVSFTAGRLALYVATLVLLLVGVAGLYFNYRKHGKYLYLVLGILVSGLLFYAQQFQSDPIIYSGAAVLFLNAIFDYRQTRKKRACCRIKRKK